jgi:mRNA interferase MazF
VLRGEIHLVDLDPSVGSEANKTRPAIIVSNDGANRTAQRLGRGVITIVPVSTNVDRIYPFQVHLPSLRTGLDRESKAQAEQVRSIDVTRVGRLIGMTSPDLLHDLDEALRLHLGL